MTNVIDSLISRIEDYRKTNQNPCKSYATKEAAEKATAAMARKAAKMLDKNPDAQPASYLVFFNEAWGRWVGAIDLNQLITRQSFAGGYVGCCTGFYTY